VLVGVSERLGGGPPRPEHLQAGLPTTRDDRGNTPTRAARAGQAALWACQGYYGAMSLVNGSRAAGLDLFEGLR
jgi:hypothetical protein